MSFESMFNEKVTQLEIPGTRKFSNQVKQYKDGVDLTLGQSDFETPDFIKKAMIESISNNHLRYTHNKGLPELRTAISESVRKKNQTYYDPETEIIVTNGGSEAIDSILRSIINPGDEVIIPCPSYLGYAPVVRLLGATPVFIDTRATNFVPTKKLIEEAITEKTKAIIFNFPTNPTGKVLTYYEMEEIVDCLKDKSLFIISDEIYSENIYGVTFHSFMVFEEIRKQLFVINGLSKSHAMTGARIGYILSNPFFIEQVTKVHLYNTICAATPSQYGALAAMLENNQSGILNRMNQAYRQRRDFLYHRLNQMGLPVEIPNGAFYIFPDISSFNLDSYEFAEQLLEKEHLAVVPGSSFSEYGEGHIRLSYACSMEELEEACLRLERFLQNFKEEVS